jgi:hypothetical protein
MAHGENAERGGHPGREYWSRRWNPGCSWTAWAKLMTHRKERREAARLVRSEKLSVPEK